MSEAFGARLRDCRERRQIPLRTIAEQTKISIALLEGLERGDVSHWPGGIFRRAFVRAYAQAIGLDADATVREFIDLFPDPDQDVTTALAAAVAAQQPAGPVRRLRAAFGSTVRSLGGSVSADRSPRVTIAEPPPAVASAPAPLVPPAPPEPPALSPAATAATIEVAEQEPELLPATPAPAAEQPLDNRENGPAAPAWQLDLAALARLCRAFGCAEDPADIVRLFGEAAGLLDAAGVILWTWDPDRAVLRAALAHGYSAAVLAHVPAVERDAANVTAAAFRLGDGCTAPGDDRGNGALAVPLMTPSGCAGVLALELPNGLESDPALAAAATIVAAQLAAMIAVPAEAVADRKRA